MNEHLEQERTDNTEGRTDVERGVEWPTNGFPKGI